VFARRQNWLAAVLVGGGLFLVIYGLIGSGNGRAHHDAHPHPRTDYPDTDTDNGRY
jgi:hypothetical protein